MKSGRVLILLTIGLALSVAGKTVLAQPPRVLAQGQQPHDRRLGALKDLNGYFPFSPPPTKEAWEKRAGDLKRRILVSTGLWPMPEKTALEARVYGRTERDGFTVEKVYFESLSGHFVTGLLFRPRGKSGPFPGVLSPHGHGGRLQDHGDKIRQLIVEGRERFESSGRFPKLARCAQLARMGCVTFIYDMLGYADSVQIPYKVAHRIYEPRPGSDTRESWRFFSTQAELRMQSILGLQTWNSVRALDFLASLPDVDESRLAITGGSGGGTQTILLGGIDPRPIVAFPQGMVSTSMQGGCTCENASLLRIGTGNVELAALFAPRPLGMTAANDWTRAMMSEGYPALQSLYSLYGARDRVFCKSLVHFPHNYNYVTRALMYSWMNRHLGLGLEEPIVEEDWPLLTAEERRVWDSDHPEPGPGEDDAHERAVTKWLDTHSRRQLDAMIPSSPDSLGRYREVVGSAWSTLIGCRLPRSEDIEWIDMAKTDRGDFDEFRGLLRFSEKLEEIPVVRLYPRNKDWSGQVALWIDGEGKSGIYGVDGNPRQPIRRLLQAGVAVLGADLLYQGEFLGENEPPRQTRKVLNSRPFAGYTFTYNHTLFAQRVHDILTLIAYASSDDRTQQLDLIGVNGAAPWAAAASAVADRVVDRLAVDTKSFRFIGLESYRDPDFLPGAVKYGDLPGLLSLSAPRPIWVGGEAKVPLMVSALYQASGKSNSVTLFDGSAEATIQALVRWVIH